MQARRASAQTHASWKNETADSPKLNRDARRNLRVSGTLGGRALALNPRMSAVKIGASRQVIIPKKVYEELGLAAGDYLDVKVQDGSLLMSPKTLVDKPVHTPQRREEQCVE